MKIFITSTPEILGSLKEEVCSLLNIEGINWEFIAANSVDLQRLRAINPLAAQLDEGDSPSFHQFFSICETFRLLNAETTNEDFVVLLTSIRNKSSWFSATEIVDGVKRYYAYKRLGIEKIAVTKLQSIYYDDEKEFGIITSFK